MSDGRTWLIIDEAAFITSETWNAEVRPALSGRRARAVFISTPDGRNLLYDLYQSPKDKRPCDGSCADWDAECGCDKEDGD